MLLLYKMIFHVLCKECGVALVIKWYSMWALEQSKELKIYRRKTILSNEGSDKNQIYKFDVSGSKIMFGVQAGTTRLAWAG